MRPDYYYRNQDVELIKLFNLALQETDPYEKAMLVYEYQLRIATLRKRDEITINVFDNLETAL